VPSADAQRAITIDSVVVAAKDQVSSYLAGEVVVLSLQTGRYYGLDRVGARIWDLLRTPARVADIRDAIVRQYEVEPDHCERDVLTLLQRLASQELIEITDGTDQIGSPARTE